MDPLEDQNGNVVFIRVDNIDEETILNFDNVQNEVRSDIICLLYTSPSPRD